MQLYCPVPRLGGYLPSASGTVQRGLCHLGVSLQSISTTGAWFQQRHPELLPAQLRGHVSSTGKSERQWRPGSAHLPMAEAAEERITGMPENYMEFYEGIGPNSLHVGRTGILTKRSVCH